MENSNVIHLDLCTRLDPQYFLFSAHVRPLSVQMLGEHVFIEITCEQTSKSKHVHVDS